MRRIRSAPPAPSSSTIEMARATARGSPAITRSARSALACKEELSRDDQPLDLAGALADGGELDVAEELFRGVILDEAVSTVDLDAVLGGADGNLARVQLGHRGLQ